MGLVISTDDKGIVIYRNDRTSKAGNPYTTYSLRISSKDKDGNWESAFMDVRFKKGVEVGNKTTIKIKNAFYVTNNFGDRTGVALMILDFETISAGESSSAPAVDFANIPADLEEELPFV